MQKRKFNASVLAMMLAWTAAATTANEASAAGYTVAPGGLTTLAGEIQWAHRSHDEWEPSLQGACVMNMKVNLNPSDASFTVGYNDVEIVCSTPSQGYMTTAAIYPENLPWTGTTETGSGYVIGKIPNFSISIYDTSGFGPPLLIECEAPSYWYFRWLTGYAQTFAVPLESSSGPCDIGFTLYESPNQTFTKKP
ncbi:hypothetical protein [Dokdonella ginsengisoli]|uniref:Secreted protein n=1 Tax=Dokdonella ginsengisoli TaxID=363846 RepID=A0ABV9QT08_9GAMM